MEKLGSHLENVDLLIIVEHNTPTKNIDHKSALKYKTLNYIKYPMFFPQLTMESIL